MLPCTHFLSAVATQLTSKSYQMRILTIVQTRTVTHLNTVSFKYCVPWLNLFVAAERECKGLLLPMTILTL